MKAANPVEKDSKTHHSQSKKQRQRESVVVPLPEIEVTGTQIQNSEYSPVKAGSTDQNSNRINLNGTIAPVHGSQTIYDQGAEVMYGKFQESLIQTGDINHPDTKELENGYMSTLNINQISDYHNLKSRTYLPKTVQEQAVMDQIVKGNSETTTSEIPLSTALDEVQSVQNSVIESDISAGLVLPVDQEDAAVRTTPTDPHSDPQFNQTLGLVKSTAKAKRIHTTKDKAETHANAAAAVPGGERKSKARGQQVEQLDQQKASPFKASDFKAKLESRIKNMKLPVNEKGVENFEKNNNIAQVNRTAVADVVASKNSVTGGIEAVSKQEPNESKIAQRTATALPDPKIGSKVNIKATNAMPAKRGDSELSEPIAKSYKAVEQQFEKNNITDEQLANSNEPTFINALNAKNAVKENAENAPKEFKTAESKKLEASKQYAQGKTNTTMEGMHHSRKEMLDGVTQKQHKAGEKNTGKHQEVVNQLNQIYANTKKSVDGELNDLERKVTELFDAGATIAKTAFEEYITEKINEYKEERYGAWYRIDKYGKRLEDAWNGSLPPEINKYFTEGRRLFLQKLDSTINDIAKLVTDRLNKAKTAITSGRKQVVTFIKNLPGDVKKAIKGDIDAIQGQFKELENSISDKETSLIDSLVTKYNDTLKEVDDMAADIRKRNQGLLADLRDATVGVWETIQNIRKTLTDLLSGALNVVLSIVAHPIDFLSNLIAGVGQGFSNFGANIWTHLKTGFFGWLTGAMKGITFTMPEDVFSLKGIFSITTQVLGLTWEGIRAIGSKVVGEPVMKVLETGFEMVQIVRKEGVAGLWEHLKDQFADLKETVMDAIMDIIQTQVIQAGIKWIMGLLTPVGAFIKAAMAIIDVVKFFIQRAAQIMELVKAFTESVAAIASGNVGAVAKSIENALGRAVPVLIGFLASLLGIGGLADKVIGVIRKIRQRIEGAITKFWNFVKVKGGKLLNKLGIGKKGKDDGKSKEKTSKNDEKLEDVEVGKVINFSAEGEQHKLWINTKGNNVEVMVASTPMSVSDRLKKWEGEIHTLPKEEQERAKALLSEAKSQYLETNQDARETDKALDKAKKQNASNDEIKKAEKLDDKVEDKEKRLSHTLQQLFSIFGEGNELKYSIKKLMFVRNEEVNIAEGKYPHDFAKQLSSLENTILKLDKNNEIRDEVRAIRRKWKIQKGALYSPFVEEYQQSFSKMRDEVKGDFIITTETGGSLLGDSLTKNTDVKNVKIGKAFDKHQAKQPQDVAKYIIDFMKGREQEVVRIKIVDAMVSGTSAKNIIKNALAQIANSNKYPNLTFELHLMQETIGRNEKQDEQDVRVAREIYINEANRVELYFNKTRFTLGEDVDAQAQYNHHEPVIIFKGSDATLAAYSIIPQEETSTRNIIIGLANGEFNGKLDGVL